MNLSSQFIVKIIHQRRIPLKRVLLHLDERLGAELGVESMGYR